MDESSFIAALKESPGDRGVQQRYADWFTEARD
ncbi:hypothetical protein CA54_46940 [Symmachiella macrocystis]|uniref:Uncharacterized protein n=1 Tax=Symmachiella macrocystis TaxID=2527985 RepID=A0A5C6BCL3_9PLAN|nr:hypothetical protein CA54_46940 [Symmachiella macrocystis]